MPIGAELQAGGGVHFRIWAPLPKSIVLIVDDLVRLSGERAERLLIFNFGRDLAPRIIPEPLFAPPADGAWRLLWSSEHPAYGGDGVREPIDPDGGWYVQGRAAFVLAGEW